jgi:hypothetical protein
VRTGSTHFCNWHCMFTTYLSDIQAALNAALTCSLPNLRSKVLIGCIQTSNAHLAHTKAQQLKPCRTSAVLASAQAPLPTAKPNIAVVLRRLCQHLLPALRATIGFAGRNIRGLERVAYSAAAMATLAESFMADLADLSDRLCGVRRRASAGRRRRARRRGPAGGLSCHALQSTAPCFKCGWSGNCNGRPHVPCALLSAHTSASIHCWLLRHLRLQELWQVADDLAELMTNAGCGARWRGSRP